MDDGLDAYIAAAKRANVADAFVFDMLRAAGWPERRVYAAFAAYYDQQHGLVLPVRGRRLESARDAFLYLLGFISLGCWTVGVGHLFYVLIDRRFPSGLDSPYLRDSTRFELSFELATIIVAFPIFIAVGRLIARQLGTRPEAAESGVRKWLTYVALVIAAVTVLGDAIFFLSEFFQGDLTVRFVLKSVVLVVLAGGVFVYYLATLKRDTPSALWERLFAALASVVVAAALLLGFLDFGTLGHARAVAFDHRRIETLLAIANGIHEGGSKEPLPRDLATAAGANVRLDPETRLVVSYRPLGGSRYELCAPFKTASTEPLHPAFAHPAGRTCFALDAARVY